MKACAWASSLLSAAELDIQLRGLTLGLHRLHPALGLSPP